MLRFPVQAPQYQLLIPLHLGAATGSHALYFGFVLRGYSQSNVQPSFAFAT